MGYDELRYRLWYHAGVALHSVNLDLNDSQSFSVPSSFGLFTVDGIDQTIYYLNGDKTVRSFNFDGNAFPDALPVSEDIQDLQIDVHNR